MWKVRDCIVGEEITFKSYIEAFEEAERRVMMHGQDFPYRHRGHHYAIECDMVEDKNTKTITISSKQ